MKKFRSILFTFSLFLILGGLAYAAPQAPVVTVGVDNLDVTISWDSVEGAAGYNVCYSVYPGGTPISCVDVGDVTSVAVTLLAGESYYVACQAHDESGASRYSNIEAVSTPGPSSTSATRALEHMAYISDTIGIRVAGSPEEKTTRDYIAGQLMELGLSVSLQKFRFEDGGAFGESFNVVAVIPGASAQQLIVGAHYDSVEVGEGASDNASGVGALLAAAEALIGQTPPYTVVFIAFGAEEIGLKGSRYYASNMAAQDVADTIGMINLDTLVGGDMVYVYGDAGDAGWIRDQALALSPTRTVTLQTNPGLNPDYPA
ncbi:MAG: M20/M25/M40 family metallo-hydrolase, partial [Desulfobacterales bacterium]|nr:M20/M25/M40 family metallo-hydrolase [Desulfobacterales bacterium]